MRDLAVEHLTAANLDDLVAMFAAVDRSHFAHATKSAAHRFLQEVADVHLIGRVDGQVVAFGMLRGWHEGYETPSLGIAVRVDAEGRGYGRAMMRELERAARARGAKQIRLRVHPKNARARRLYESCGYGEVGVDRGEVLMLLDLADDG